MIFCDPGRDVVSCLPDEQLSTQNSGSCRDLISFISRELSVFGRVEFLCHFVEWLLFCVDNVFS